ncbi:MAG: hypothetical protein ABL984_20975 [Pyrinomonadaceae bacterium]
MFKTFLFLVAHVVLLQVVIAFATPQRPDILKYEGKEYPISAGLLEPYFAKYPGRHPNQSEGRSSSLWRGYIATFEISDGSLFLKEINAGFQTESALGVVVPDRKRLKIDWYTGLLLSGHGELLGDPMSLDFSESYEKYTIFEIGAGTFRSVRHFDRKKYISFCTRQYDAFKKTGDFQAILKELSEKGRSLEMSEEMIRESILFHSKKFLVD